MKTLEEREADAACNRQGLAHKARSLKRPALGLGVFIALLYALEDDTFTATQTSLQYADNVFVPTVLMVALGIFLAYGAWFRKFVVNDRKIIAGIGVVIVGLGLSLFESSMAQFNLETRTATVGYTRIFGQVEQTFALKDLRAVVVKSARGNKGSVTYRICFDIGRECVYLNGSGISSSRRRMHAEELHQWLGKHGYPVGLSTGRR